MRLLQDTAHAKINLFLHVTGRRSDGYHLLDSLAVFAGVGDQVSMQAPAEEMSLAITGHFGKGLDCNADNLVLRAANLLRDATKSTGAWNFKLEKNLPVASGIGGGSADAACALRLLATEWKSDPSILYSVAEKLGADVPVCIAQKATRMQGIGEVLHTVPQLPDIGMLLINPGVGVSTPAIFKSFTTLGGIRSRQEITFPEKWETASSLFSTLRETGNDLQAPAILHAPIIQDVLNAIALQQGCEISRMSGSGATCFGLFSTPAEAESAQQSLSAQAANLGWWTWAGPLHQSP